MRKLIFFYIFTAKWKTIELGRFTKYYKNYNFFSTYVQNNHIQGWRIYGRLGLKLGGKIFGVKMCNPRSNLGVIFHLF